MPRVFVASEKDLELFDGVMIEVNEPCIGKYQVPGWECKSCGWRVGSVGLPPPHECPEDGEKQRAKEEA